jgi:two-component system LytT family response regulator
MLSYIIISNESYAKDTFIPSLRSNYNILKCVGTIFSNEDNTQKINDLNPDIIFLDPDTLDVFSILDKIDNSCYKTIFVSDTEKYAYSAFLHGVNEYILKADFLRVLDKIVLRLLNNLYAIEELNHHKNTDSDKSNRISISTSEGLIFIEVSNIIRIEADRSYCYLHLVCGSKMTVCKSLKDIEQRLPTSQFYRTHNSHLVNLNYVKMIGYQDGGYVLMIDESHIPIARRRKNELVNYMTA